LFSEGKLQECLFLLQSNDWTPSNIHKSRTKELV
jgi:hypothetical protein